MISFAVFADPSLSFSDDADHRMSALFGNRIRLFIDQINVLIVTAMYRME